MEIPKILPQFTETEVSRKGFLNIEDLKKMVRNILVFITPTIILYGAQLLGSLNDNIVLSLADLTPSKYVVGAFQGYLISTVLDYLKKLNDGGK